ncbi:MAG TPA: WD40 repeat domain-containing protein, partial [Planctomycetaceae bacterium]
QVVAGAADGRALQLPELRRFFHGAPSQRDLENAQAKVLELHWHSLIRDYTIQLRLTDKGELAMVETGGYAGKALPNTSSGSGAGLTDGKVATRPAAKTDPDQVARDKVNAQFARLKENTEAERAFADVVLPEKHDFDPAATDLVQTMFREHPRSALPSGRDVAEEQSTPGEVEWLRQQYMDNYEKYGSRNSKWDRAAMAFLADGAAALAADKLPADQAAKAAEPGADLLQSGCDDALVCYVVGALYFRFNDGKGAAFREQAFEKFRDSRYPLDCVLRFTLPHARRQAWARIVYSYRKRSADLDGHGLYGASPIYPARRFLLLACLRYVPWNSYAKSREFLEAIYCVVQFDPWLKAMLTGRYFSALSGGVDLNSTDVRGTGKKQRAWIMPVKMDEVQYRHSWSAQAYYLDAWKIDPHVPEAASRILTEARRRRTLAFNALNQGQIIALAADEGKKSGWPEVRVREATRFWFDQALRGGFAFMPAYQQMLGGLQEKCPEAEFIEQILGFGRECLATARFDTPVPFVYLDSLDLLRKWLKDDKVYRQPGVYDECCLMIDGYRQLAQTENERDRLKSINACLAIRAQKNDDARRLVNELGDLADGSVFEAQGLDLTACRKMLNEKHPNHRLLPALDRPVVGVAFSGDDDTLLTAEGNSQTTTRWNLKERIAIGVFSQEADVAALVAASPDGKLVATAGTAGAVYVWDAARGALLQTLAHNAQVRGIRFSPQGTRLATAAWDNSLTGGTVRVWDVITGQEVAERTSPESIFHDVAFVGSETTLALASGSYLGPSRGAPGEIGLWDLAADQTTKTFRGLFERHSNGFAVSADGKYLAALGQGIRNQGTGTEYFPTEVRIVDLIQGEVVQTVVREPGGITAATFIGRGELLATAEPDRVVRLWSIPECRLVAELTGHRDRVVALAAAPEASRLASVDAGGRLKVWDLSAASTASQAQETLLDFPFRAVVRIEADPQGRFIATGDARYGVVFWERADGWRPSTVFPLLEQLRMRDFDVSPDGKLLAIVGEALHVDSNNPAAE